MTLNEAQPLAKEWQRITGKSLFEMVLPVWVVDGECVPNPMKIDEWLGTPKGVSTFAYLREKHGTRAVEILRELIKN